MLINFPTRALVCTASALFCSAGHAQDLSRVLDFSIAPNRLSAAIIEFSQQTGIQVVIAGEDVSRLSTHGVSGRLPISQALHELLTGTELRFEVIGESTVAVISRASSTTQTREGSGHRFERIAAADDRAFASNEAPPASQRASYEPGTVEEVIVNAYRPAAAIGGSTKTDTPLIETAQSVSVVTREELDARDVQNLNEAVRYNAGVLAESQGIDNRMNDIYIRGFDAGSWNNNLTLDGMRLVQGSMWNRLMIDNWNLERVEVLKGPSAVLYGQVAPGGLVNQVTKLPMRGQKQQVRLGLDEHGRYTGSGDIGGTMGDAAAWRLVGLYSDGDTQIDHVQQQHWFVAPSVSFALGERTQLTLLGMYQEDEGGSSYQQFPYRGTVVPTSYGYIDNTTFIGEPDWNTYDRTVWHFGLQFKHDFGNGWTFHQSARKLHVDSFFQTTIGGTATLINDRVLGRRAVQAVGDSDGYSTDTRLQGKFSTGAFEHTLLIGFDWLKVDQNSFREAARVALDTIAIDVFAPVYTHYDFASVLFPQISGADSYRQQGLYVQDQISIDRWRFTVSLRNDWANNEIRDRLATRNGLTKTDDSAFTGRGGVLYLFDNGVAPYVSYAESFQPSTTSLTSNAALVPFDPTTGLQWEAGVKFQPPGSDGLLTLSAYQLEQQNVLTTDMDPTHSCGGLGPGSCLVQTGEVRVRGVELEGRITPVPGFSMIGAITRMDSQIVASNALNERGNDMIRVPDWMGNLWVDYTFMGGALEGIGLAGGVRYLGETFGDTANTLAIADYTLFDVAVRSSLARFGWPQTQVTVNANNLADKRYVATCTFVTSCTYGTGRSITASIRVNW